MRSHGEVKPLQHRFRSKHKLRYFTFALLCTLLFAGTFISTQLHSDTTVLSFPTAAQRIDPFDTKLRIHLLDRMSSQETVYQEQPTRMLYPGGQAIGILLRTDGILVIGYSPVQVNQEEVYPAKEVGIQAGDMILRVNETQIIHDDELARLVDQLGKQGKEITLKIQRQNRTFNKTITPIYCEDTNTYRIGLFVRDNAGGVGTLTFVDPTTMQYGALGHMITNSETQRKLSILNGKLVAADIQGIKKGTVGTPGEKIGRFVSNDALGTISKNTSAGIFGTLSNRKILTESIAQQPIPIATSNEIMLGSATIYTALDGSEVNEFAIEIEKIIPSGRDGKNLVIRVTDSELLSRTGGIVQGMSGSPIIQDGKLIGAVTHVLVNDPSRGYGIFIENMLEAAG